MHLTELCTITRQKFRFLDEQVINSFPCLTRHFPDLSKGDFIFYLSFISKKIEMYTNLTFP